jgi:transposase-like protein
MTIRKSQRPFVKRMHSPEVKTIAVQELESGKLSVDEVMNKYQIATTDTLRKWVKAFGKGLRIPSKMPRFSLLERRQIVLSIETGGLTFDEAVKRYKINEGTLYNWLKRFSSDIASKQNTCPMETPSQDLLQNSNKEQIEALKLKIAALETMIDVAEKEFNIPIRKKHGSKQ